MNLQQPLVLANALLFAIFLCNKSPGAVIANFETADTSTNVATGTLNGIAFTFEATVVRPQSFSGSGITGAVLDESSDRFNSVFFTPPIASSDFLELGSTSDFRFTFAAPVSDITLHVSELAGNSLAFSSSFTLLSSDGDFTVPNSSTITGVPAGGPGNGGSVDDANGSLLFAGSFTQLSWSSNAIEPADGFTIQISAVPEPNAFIVVCGGLALFMLRRTKR